MSGGHWGYVQYKIEEAADEIRRMSLEIRVVDKENTFETGYPDNVRNIYAEAWPIVKAAAKIIHAIDWEICGDTGYDTMIPEVEKALRSIKKNIEKWSIEND
jgi:hypothetical protein